MRPVTDTLYAGMKDWEVSKNGVLVRTICSNHFDFMIFLVIMINRTVDR